MFGSREGSAPSCLALNASHKHLRHNALAFPCHPAEGNGSGVSGVSAELKRGRFTYDSYVSMPHGPVLSATLDRINERPMYEGRCWDRHITPKRDNEVALRNAGNVPNDQLSKAEEGLIDEIFQTYGHLNRWDLVALTHQLPEWTDPAGSSQPIDPADILLSEGYTEEDVADMRAEWEEAAYAASLFT